MPEHVIENEMVPVQGVSQIIMATCMHNGVWIMAKLELKYF